MSGANVAVAMLVILGALLVVLGLFAGGGNLPIIALGLAAVAVGGVIGVFGARSSDRG
ncbi:MAG TPA: hypothetical protein VFL75_00270 [Candidatus Limnocylindria bacterium]|jgi:hypothetical protein|nr:hypothetical protein [Candidatus Limnocylindria bacterium]